MDPPECWQGLKSINGTSEFGFSLPPGIWTSRGYGMVFNATETGQIDFLEETEISCLLNNFVLDILDENPKVLSGDTAIVTASAETINEFVFDRTNTFTAGCSNGITPSLGDPDYERNPLVDFDILVQNFREHYAFFEERNIDWDALSSDHRS